MSAIFSETNKLDESELPSAILASHDIIAQWIQEGSIVAARGEWYSERPPAMSLVAHLPSWDSASCQGELLVETKVAIMAINRPSCSKAGYPCASGVCRKVETAPRRQALASALPNKLGWR